jgi:DNA-binding LacI/PurR family transcriptional regulator
MPHKFTDVRLVTKPNAKIPMKATALSSPVTLRDIARTLNVSHVTVSLALRGSPRISTGMRTRIHQAATQMGYRRNMMATALGHQRQITRKRAVNSKIAWINFWKNPKQLRSFREFDLYWKGAYAAAEAHGYRLEEFACGDRISPSELEKLLLAQHIEGILLPPHGGGHVPPGLEQIDWNKFCTVRFGHSIYNPASHVVASNYLHSGLLAVENMGRLGYRRIGYVTMFSYAQLFRSGYCVRQSHWTKSELLPTLFLRTVAGIHSNLNLLSAWLKENRPEAIITDLPKLRGMLETLGYRIPKDIGLAATSIHDGNADAGIDQNSEGIGVAAVDTLVALIRRNDFGIPSNCSEISIEGSWVDGSTLPPRQQINSSRDSESCARQRMSDELVIT